MGQLGVRVASHVVQRLAAGVAGGVACLALIGAPAAAETGGVAIGDSVMTGAVPNLVARGYNVDAITSRDFIQLTTILANYGDGLPHNVVIHLGTNGAISLADCKEAVGIAGADRQVFFVNVRASRPWVAQANRTLKSCVRSFPSSRVHLVDWKGLSAGKSTWFAGDGIHLRAKGAKAYARIIDRAVAKYSG